MSYQHGVYAEYPSSGLTVPAKCSTLPIIFGVGPVHQLRSFAASVAQPVLLDSDKTAAAHFGYSGKWDSYSLGEPHYVHFRGPAPSAPVVFVNALDPAKHKKSEKTTVSVTFVNGLAYIEGTDIILGTVTIAEKQQGIDFDAAYDSEGKGVILTDLKATITQEVTVSWFDTDLTAITPEAMATMIRGTIALVYETTGKVPALLCAPGWSHHRVVNDALKNAAQAINGHWNGFVFGDMDVQETDTGEKAIAKKAADVRTAAIESPCWPMATDGQHYFHLSTLAVADSLLLDAQNYGSPHETTSNRRIAIIGLVVGDGSGGYNPYKQDMLEANKLNAVGIKTATFWGGQYVLWGPHTGAYGYNSATLAEDIFDCSVRMRFYIGNSFQLQYGTEVDRPMHRSRVETIKNSFQEWLDNLISRGALLHGKIDFVTEDNPISDMISGEFVFDTTHTTTPPGRVIKTRCRYTPDGLVKLAGGDEA